MTVRDQQYPLYREEFEHNFAAGMSGGIAYVLDGGGQLEGRMNAGHARACEVSPEGAAELRTLLEMHVAATGSQKGKSILEHFGDTLPKFRMIISDEYLAYVRKH